MTAAGAWKGAPGKGTCELTVKGDLDGQGGHIPFPSRFSAQFGTSLCCASGEQDSQVPVGVDVLKCGGGKGYFLPSEGELSLRLYENDSVIVK